MVGSRWRLASIVLCGVLLLTGCGDDDPADNAPPTPTATLAPTPTTVVREPLEIADPVWALGVDPDDGSPSEPVEWFPTDTPALYAVFETTAIPSGTSFTVAWTMNGTPVPGLDPTLQIRADTPAGWIEFHLDRTSESPWPSGMLEIALTVDGEVVASGTVELRD